LLILQHGAGVGEGAGHASIWSAMDAAGKKNKKRRLPEESA